MIATILVLAFLAYAAGSPDSAARAGRKGVRVGVASGRAAGRQAWERTEPRRAARSAQATTWLRRTRAGRAVLGASRVLEGIGAAFWWTCGAAGDVAVVAGSAVAGGVRAAGPGARDAWRSRSGASSGQPTGQSAGQPGEVPAAGVAGQPGDAGGQAPPVASGQPDKVPATTPTGQPGGQPGGQEPGQPDGQPGQPATGRPPHLTVVPDPTPGTLPGPPLPPTTGSPPGQPAGTTDSTTGTQPGGPNDTPKEHDTMPQAPQNTAALVAEWTNIDAAIQDADSVRARVLAVLDELAELAAHSRAMPDRMAAAPFHPGPGAATFITALVDATPDPQRLTDWADAAHAATEALRSVKATVGEQVEATGVSGEARALASA